MMTPKGNWRPGVPQHILTTEAGLTLAELRIGSTETSMAVR
jgi:hypothetical protein